MQIENVVILGGWFSWGWSGWCLPPGSGVPGGWEVGRVEDDVLVLLGNTLLLDFVNLRLLLPALWDLILGSLWLRTTGLWSECMGQGGPVGERETEKEKHLCLSFFICLFVCSPVVFGVPARDQIQDTMVTYAAASTMQDPLTHYTGLGIEPASWCCRDAADPIVP